jgi:hypothetical protein
MQSLVSITEAPATALLHHRAPVYPWHLMLLLAVRVRSTELLYALGGCLSQTEDVSPAELGAVSSLMGQLLVGVGIMWYCWPGDLCSCLTHKLVWHRSYVSFCIQQMLTAYSCVPIHVSGNWSVGVTSIHMVCPLLLSPGRLS